MLILIPTIDSKVLRAAVAQCLAQVRPQTNLPHDGNITECVQYLLPVMEQVFEVPKGPPKGSSVWVRSVIQREEYTFRDCVEYPEIMLHYVRTRMKEGKKTSHQRGYPIKLEKEVVPTIDDVYECHAGLFHRKGSTKPHRECVFFRSASADAAFLALKNCGKYLVRVKACDMPTGTEWDNFAEVSESPVLTSIIIDTSIEYLLMLISSNH